MAKIDEFTKKIADLLTEANISEYIEIKSEKFSITNTIRLDREIALDATLFCKIIASHDAEIVFRAVAVISKRHPVKVKEIRYEIGADFNRYIVDLEIGGFGWVQFDD